MIKCYICGAVFEDSEVRTREEYVSEFFEKPTFVRIPSCPVCGSEDIDEYKGEDQEGADQ
ncbi:MAG: hypothetical protein J5647_05630 [Spirochaetaceae bacterium]|nr:hypothetical protein [Spirochaetaceae bacterium]